MWSVLWLSVQSSVADATQVRLRLLLGWSHYNNKYTVVVITTWLTTTKYPKYIVYIYIYVCMFLLLPLCRYHCWCTISSRGFHPPSNQYLDTDMVYLIYIFIKIYCSQIMKYLLKLRFSRSDIGDLSWVWLFCYSVEGLWFPCSQRL